MKQIMFHLMELVSTIQAVVVSRSAGEIRNIVEVAIKSLFEATNRTICGVTNRFWLDWLALHLKFDSVYF